MADVERRITCSMESGRGDAHARLVRDHLSNCRPVEGGNTDTHSETSHCSGMCGSDFSRWRCSRARNYIDLAAATVYDNDDHIVELMVRQLSPPTSISPSLITFATCVRRSLHKCRSHDGGVNICETSPRLSYKRTVTTQHARQSITQPYNPSNLHTTRLTQRPSSPPQQIQQHQIKLVDKGNPQSGDSPPGYRVPTPLTSILCFMQCDT